MGPAAPPLPTLPNGCFHRWQEQEELREAQALSRSVAVTPLRPPEAAGAQVTQEALVLAVSWAL